MYLSTLLFFPPYFSSLSTQRRNVSHDTLPTPFTAEAQQAIIDVRICRCRENLSFALSCTSFSLTHSLTLYFFCSLSLSIILSIYLSHSLLLSLPHFSPLVLQFFPSISLSFLISSSPILFFVPQRCVALIPSLDGAPVLDTWSRFRPARSHVRVEVDDAASSKDGAIVVHNYGEKKGREGRSKENTHTHTHIHTHTHTHSLSLSLTYSLNTFLGTSSLLGHGGSGIMCAWPSADKVLALLKDRLKE